MKQVPSCFGRVGNSSCQFMMCNDSKECYECYWKYYFDRKNGIKVNIDDVIRDYCTTNKLNKKRREDVMRRMPQKKGKSYNQR